MTSACHGERVNRIKPAFSDHGAASHDFVIVISTRRFFARPSGSSAPFGFVFGAIGFVLPHPRVCSCGALVPPLATSHCAIDAARFSRVGTT
jgi:hypothetical protein